MGVVNNLLGAAFEGILMPFRSLPAWVALAVLALVSSVGVLMVYKKVSRQASIDRVKRQIHACFYEIRLFNDDLGAVMRAQAEIIRHNGHYLALNLVPLVVMIVPFVLIISQLQSHYGWDGLEPGEPVLLKATMSKDWEPANRGKPPVSLTVPDGVRVETEPVWIPRHREMAWRIAGVREGDYQVSIEAGGTTTTKQLFVASERGRRSPVSEKPGFLHQLLYPGEATLANDGPVQSIEVHYPDRSIDLFGWSIPALAGIPAWMIVYFVLSMVFAFALKDRFGVTF